MHGFDVVAVAWSRTASGWERHLVRECTSCHTLKTTPMVYVDFSGLLCLHCLGQRVVRHQALNGEWAVRCEDCGGITLVDEIGSFGQDVQEPEAALFDELYLTDMDDEGDWADMEDDDGSEDDDPEEGWRGNPS